MELGKINVSVKHSTKLMLNKIADANNQSLNYLINNIFEEYLYKK